AGEEAQSFAGLDGRAREDDPIDFAARECGGGAGDGKVGLAGAGGTRAEDKLLAADRRDIGLLHGPARRHQLAAGADCTVAVFGGAHRCGHSGRALDVAAGDVEPIAYAFIERRQHALGTVARSQRALDGNPVAARRNIDAKPVLDERKMLIVLAKQRSKQAVVVEYESSEVAIFQNLAGPCAGNVTGTDAVVQRQIAPLLLVSASAARITPPP